jgi:hypothetical protein
MFALASSALRRTSQSLLANLLFSKRFKIHALAERKAALPGNGFLSGRRDLRRDVLYLVDVAVV